MHSTIDFYNSQLKDLQAAKLKNSGLKVDDLIDTNPSKISWSRSLKQALNSNKQRNFEKKSIVKSLHRPFTKEYFYFNRDFNECVYQQPKLFPSETHSNLVICTIGVGEEKGFSTLLTDSLIDLKTLYNCQCFPLYYYEERQKQSPGLFDTDGDTEFIRRDGVSDFILGRAKTMYGKTVSKEDIFYYVYGFLHSPGYREKFANDLRKMLPRLPLVEDVRDFWKFSKAGRALAELHINYETVPAYDGAKVTGADSGLYTVEKMRFPKKDQKDTIYYNPKITVENIPAKAYDYVVNGKSAIEWIMERYAVTTHKESGIKNDPNDWAAEAGNPRYILDLLLSIINVSVQTVDIVKALPQVSFE